MASQTIKSSSVVFLDTTDDRKLEAYISSNLATTQIFNVNNDTYTPDWSTTNLQLNANIFLDSKEVTSDTQTSIIWYEKIGTGAPNQIGTSASLTISTNRMFEDISIITYICEAKYQGIEARSQITFNRSDTGLNGTNGADGTSVTIIDSYDTLEELQTAHPTGNAGDSYIVDGDLYVWSVDNSTWKNVGQIQGPQGKPGESAKSIILNADAQVFKVGKSSTSTTPETIIVTAQVINIEKSTLEWWYSTDGKDFSPLIDGTQANGAQRTSNTVTITGDNMTSNTIIIKASSGSYSDIYTVYKVFDGKDGSQGFKGDSAPIAFLTNENITFSADAQGQITGTTITTNVVAYDGTEKVLPTVGEPVGLPDEYLLATQYIDGAIYYAYSDDNPDEIILADPQPTSENFGDKQYYIKSMSVSVIPMYELNEQTVESDTSKEMVIIISVENGATLGTTQSTYGEISIPVLYPVDTTLHLNWSKINTGLSGENGDNAVVFKIYSENGYVLSKDTPSITLKTFSYIGNVPINSDATYRWFFNNNDSEWVELTEEVEQESIDETTGEVTLITTSVPVTKSYVDIKHSDVSFSCSYMCKMRFNGLDYIDVITIDDKNDTNQVFTSKPTSYSVGDIWVVGNDYAPDGVAIGTVLRAKNNNSIYTDSDWTTATKYDEQIEELQKEVGVYNQYFSFNAQEGLKISAKDSDGNSSKFSTTLSNTQLSFNEGDEAVASISGYKMHIKEAEIESPLSVIGQYSGTTMIQPPTINIGRFSFIIESNGSLSIISN